MFNLFSRKNGNVRRLPYFVILIFGLIVFAFLELSQRDGWNGGNKYEMLFILYISNEAKLFVKLSLFAYCKYNKFRWKRYVLGLYISIVAYLNNIDLLSCFILSAVVPVYLASTTYSIQIFIEAKVWNYLRLTYGDSEFRKEDIWHKSYFKP